jgi:hypothetical protein
VPNPTLAALRAAEPLRGLALRFPAPTSAPVVSDTWTVAGWRIQFARLGPHQTLALPADGAQLHVKPIAGELATPAATPFPPRGVVRGSRCRETEVRAGGAGAWLAIFSETSAVPNNVRSMSQLGFAGPLAVRLAWEPFAKRFAGITDYFDGADAHIAAGFHLEDERGVELAYVHFWTAGKGVDLSTHDHGNAPAPGAPTFAEVHWVMNNGTGSGGMYQCDAPGAARTRTPMPRGSERGPFFRTDTAGRPRRRANGAVDYPWHGWEAGPDDGTGQAYDFVCAFEINPDFVQIGGA